MQGVSMKVGDLVKCVDANFYGIIIDCDDLEALKREFKIHWIGGSFDWRFEDELEVVNGNR